VGGRVPGVRVELGRLRREGWWGVRASASYQSTRSVRVDIGDSLYDRAALGTSLVLQWNRPRTFLSNDWGLVGALTRAHGDGYSQNRASHGLSAGLAVDGRAGVRVGAYRLWADVLLCRWANRETVRVDSLSGGSASTARLPPWDAHLGLGAGVVFD